MTCLPPVEGKATLTAVRSMPRPGRSRELLGWNVHLGGERIGHVERHTTKTSGRKWYAYTPAGQRVGIRFSTRQAASKALQGVAQGLIRPGVPLVLTSAGERAVRRRRS